MAHQHKQKNPERKRSVKYYLFLHIAPLVIFCLMGAVTSVIAGQDQNFDLQNYHYYNPYAFVHHREGLDFAPAGIQTFNNPAVDLVSYTLITHFKPIIAGALLGAIQAINIWLVYEICLIAFRAYLLGFAKYLTAFVVAALSLFGAVSLGEIGVTMGDNIASIPVLLAILLALYRRNRSDRSVRAQVSLTLAAYAMMGIAVGVKLTNVPFLVGLLVADLVFWKNFRQAVYDYVTAGVGIVLGFLVSDGLWAWHLYRVYKSPLFPFYNKLFKSPYYANVNFIDPRFLPKNIAEVIFYPFYFLHSQTLTAEVPYRDGRLAALYVLTVALVIYMLYKKIRKSEKHVSPQVLMLAVFCAVSYLLWEKQFSILRYLVPVEFLALATSVVILLSLTTKRIALAVGLVLCVAVTATVKPMDYGRIHWQPTFFGVQIPSNTVTDSSTILMAGAEPLGFLAPAFPAEAPILRIDGGLTAVVSGDTPAQELVRAKVLTQEQKHSTFWGIETLPSMKSQAYAYQSYGFSIGNCQPIHTYVSQYLDSNPNYYELCRLNQVKTIQVR